MKPLGLNEIREKYLAFFESKDHLRLPSFSLVPHNDPSVLLVNAGMTPLKPFFTGAQTPPAPRITTCQKCIRTPDIERVGHTARHGTYFEMLGNFSFGDYFKKEIIPWAWEFCTQVLEMPADRLYPSVYLEDDEAYAIWRDDVGVPENRITRLGKADNFWEHGTGPCGPCSEIYFDRGAEYGCGSPDCKVGCDCDRYVEFWNLVFTQFNREEDGTYTPLAKKNIDTGAGLERFACIMQGVDNLFEVDTVRKILDTVCTKAHVAYGKDAKTDIAIRVITDHVRSTTMMISDGVLPSNEGRGYVLRRLLRRALRYGRLLGIRDPFLTDIAAVVIELNQSAYPSLLEKQMYIMTVIRKEEEAFLRTVEQGTDILLAYIGEAKSKGQKTLSGEQVFRLHDTYGFPLDLTREIAQDAGLMLDEEGFLLAMKGQRDAARAATKAKTGTAWGGKELPAELLKDSSSTQFVGYESLTSHGKLLYLMKEDEEGSLQMVPEAFAGDKVIGIFDVTPFYATSGGQMTDRGDALCDGSTAQIDSVDKDAAGKFLHSMTVMSGSLRAGQSMELRVDPLLRASTARNHTATHILQKALRSVLGEHVEQSGSLVSSDRLRFDFTHFQPMTDEEIEIVEQKVNAVILSDLAVTTRVMKLDEARKIGAMALFGEKYGDQVRVITVGDEKQAFSMEFCGGTHLSHTSQAGQMRILSETGVASGVRRIEAVTGDAAYALATEEHHLLDDVCTTLKTTQDQLARKIRATLSEVKALEKEIVRMQEQKSAGLAEELAAKAQIIRGVSVVVASVEAVDADALRTTADQVRDRMDAGVILLSAVQDDKLLFVAMATAAGIAKGIHAGNIIRDAAKAAGGGGGGRPDMAQAGGKDISKMDDALEAARAAISIQLGDDRSK
jgi:alanyl-tRNA synthetase